MHRVLGHFLVGMAAGKARVFASDGGHRRRMFRRLLATGIAIVIANAAVTLLSGGRQPEGVPAIARVGLTVLGELSTLAMVAVYMSAVALLMQRRRARSGLMLLAPTGRMPLTTYLMQSLVATFVFYGWGLGWIGAIDAAGCVAIATGIFVTQVVIAHLWLRRYRSGPLEWLWRRLVYGATPTPTPM